MREFYFVSQGWNSVRRECRVQFAICILIAMALIAISTALFFSSSMLHLSLTLMWLSDAQKHLVYRYIFLTWPFFTTVTCTAYILLIATSVFCVICRLNLGKGLADYCESILIFIRISGNVFPTQWMLLEPWTLSILLPSAFPRKRKDRWRRTFFLMSANERESTLSISLLQLIKAIRPEQRGLHGFSHHTINSRSKYPPLQHCCLMWGRDPLN